eukprot:scaffold10860_cov182-Amphora_coffeaeformis.AAC.29
MKTSIMTMKTSSNRHLTLLLLGLVTTSPGATGFQSSRRAAAFQRIQRSRRDPALISVTGVIRKTRGGAASPPILSTTSFVNEQDELDTYDYHTIPQDTSLTNNPDIDTNPNVTVEYRGGGQPGLTWWRYIIPSRHMLPELLGEAFGTFLLMQLSLGIVVSSVITDSLSGVFPIGILTGMSITTAVAAVSSKCAAHFNPAITWAMCLYRKFGWSRMIPYTVSQLFGATLAAVVNYGLYSGHIRQFEAAKSITRASLEGIASAKMTACYYSTPLVTPMAAFLAETFAAFSLAAVVFAVTSQNNKQAKGLFNPPIIGSAVALIIATIGPISGASMNPARELGPRLILKAFGWSTAAFHQIGTYMIAPIVGATLGGLFVDKFLYGTNNYEVEEGVLEDGSAVKMDMKSERKQI